MSTHVVRKAVVSDSAFDHELHDFMDDTYDDYESEDEVPETKNQNFEFSDGYGVMRVMRLVIVVQIISIALENPSAEMAVLFRITVRGVLFYAIRFYSRPFIDLLYLLQYFLEAIINFFLSQHVPADPTNIEVTNRRKLNTNPYLVNPDETPGGGAAVTVNILDDRSWHAMKHFSHYALGIEFLFMAALFTFCFWQISDYSNRSEVKVWLHRYIADGWWRRGGLNVAISMGLGLLALALVLLVVNAFATQVAAVTVPEARILGGFFAVGLSVVLVIWLVGYIFIRFTEAAFVRYVSQNVSYTSAIILKRAVKAKLDLGILLMCCVYMPVLYNLVQAVTLMTDWNDTLAPAFRKQVNFFVPCYFPAFPPYRQQELAADTCPVSQFTSPDQPVLGMRPNGFYFDANIMSCDSLLGISLFVFSATLVVYTILGYYYILSSMIGLVAREFRRSKFVDILSKLIRIREDEEESFNARFSQFARWHMAAAYELRAQRHHFVGAAYWLVLTLVRTLKGLIRAAYKPIKLFVIPLKFLAERVMVVSCMNYEAKKEEQRVLSSAPSQRFSALSSRKKGAQSGKAVSTKAKSRKPTAEEPEDAPEDGVGFSSKKSPPTRQQSQLLQQDDSWNGSAVSGGSAQDGALSKKTKAVSFRSSKVALDENYLSELDGEQAEFSLSTKIRQYTAKYDAVKATRDFARAQWKRFRRMLPRLRVVVWLKLNYSLLQHSLSEHWKKWTQPKEEVELDHAHMNVAQMGTASLGGASAAWRKERTIQSKFRLLHRLQSHIVAELRSSKIGYIADHDLLLSVMDTTVDSAGMFTLVIPYQYTRLHWFKVVFLEITIYAVLGASLSAYTDWVSRVIAFIVVNNVFGVVTYAANPYTELMDKWLDFVGRLLITFVLVCTIVCADMRPHATAHVSHKLYASWDSAAYLGGQGLRDFGMYQALDILMVAFFYLYLFYVMYAVGVLGVVERMVQSFQFGYHDHILDYIVENLDQRTFGLENIFTGLQLVQQWDDVIKLQRRYALLAWPDVRPASIVTFLAKLLEIKWASLFNLTLNNLRSSLGLTVLHTVMFAADGDVARWIIHANPDLLLVQDSQHDTPITIALKECAYFLLAYGEQNDGSLDDGTSYADEQYALYYPEVDDLRDDIYNNGEFVHDLCIPHILTSADMLTLQDEGYYREPPPQVLVVSPKKASKMDVFGNRKFTEEELAIIKQEKKRKAHARMLADKAMREKASVFAKRFPEDELIDDYEVGKMSCWSVIGMNVPETNLFLDASIVKKTLKNDNYSYELPDYDMVRGKVVHRGTLHMDHTWDGQPAATEPDIENNIVPGAVLAAQPSPSAQRPKTPGGSFVQDKDLQYVVRTSRRVHPVAKDMEVPMTHPDIRGLLDWDKRPRRGRGTSMRRDSNASASQMNTSSAASDFGGTNSRRSSVRSLNSDLLSTGSGELISRLTKLNSAKTDHETRWRICKFAEILMSEEMSKSCSRMRWNISDFKAFNKLASATQGKVAQNLAMTCSLNAPPGFVRVSEWSAFAEHLMYDEAPDSDIPMVVKTIVSIVGAAETATKATTEFLSNTVALPSMDTLRGRARRRRKSSRSLSHRDNRKDGEEGGSDHGGERLFSDRIIQYLAESYVCSNSRLNLDDAELSYNGRVGWRAIARALRLKHCSFVLPSLFVPPKLIRLTHLTLTRNEMDCGDAVLLADIFTHQLSLLYVDVSYNRIGGRGMSRIAQALRDHPHIRTFKIDHNVIGPAAGKNVGIWIKKTKCLRVLSMNHNRMGEIVRFPTIYSREKILSAVHDIFAGVKSNKSLEILDLSYNHLGPESGDVVPQAVNRHPRLHTLNFAGNDLGPVKGTKFLFYLSGFPGGAAWSLKKEAFIANIKRKQAQDEANKQNALKNGGVDVGVSAAVDAETDDGMDGYGMSESMVLSEGSTLQSHPLSPARGMPPSPSQPNALLSPQSVKKSTKKRDSSADLSAAKDEAEASCVHPCSLTSVSVADNQLSPFAGHAIGSLIERNKSLTHLDISGNALDHIGGTLVSDQLELMFGIKPREFLKIVLWEIEESKYTGRNPKKRVKIFTTLTSLNMSRNGIGPTVAASLFYTLAHPNCTITNLDVSDNPLGYTIQQGGNAAEAGVDVRLGMAESRSLRFLNLNRTHILPVEMVAILGGLVHNKNLMKIQLADLKLDEPSCLQLCTGIESCESLAHIDLQRCFMGANGSTLVAHKIAGLAERLRYLDLTDNYMGPVAAVYISEALLNPKCKIRTLRLARNDLIEEGGCFIAKALIGNLSVTDVDLSGNFLTHAVAIYIADAARGLFENGKKITDSKFRRVLLNDNPEIGPKASKTLVKALANDFVEHLELRNIGAKAGTASLIASSVRDPEIAWRILDVADNDFSRTGLNEIFWAMRRNRRLRILRCGENRAGTKFCSNADSLLSHGLSVPNCLRVNVVLRELDLSYNTMSAEAGINIMDAMIDNHTVKKLSLRGNLLDDSLAPMLGDLLRCNNVLEELDVGRNKLGFSCAFALAEALEVNRSLKRLLIDYNSFGGAGTATLEAFSRSIMMNYSLQNLVFDGNKLGPSWGVRLAETFARNNTLLQVSLRDNRLDTRSGKALLKAYRHCPHLLELALSADEIGQELWEEFRLQFEVKRASIAPGEYFQETTLSATQSKIISSYTLFH